MSLSYRTIESDTFKDVLSRYDAHIQEASDFKQKRKSADSTDSLAVLDQWRLKTLPEVLKDRRDSGAGDHLKKAEVEKLIRWKLSVLLFPHSRQRDMTSLVDILHYVVECTEHFDLVL